MDQTLGSKLRFSDPDDPNKHVELRLARFSEVDASGVALPIHTVNGFPPKASDIWTVSNDWEVPNTGGAKALYFSNTFSLNEPGQGQATFGELTIHSYVMKEDSSLTWNDETVDLPKGSLKLTFELNNYNHAGGRYIDIDFEVKTPGGRVREWDTNDEGDAPATASKDHLAQGNRPPRPPINLPPFSGVTIPPFGGNNIPPFGGVTIPPYGGGNLPPFSGVTIPPFGGGGNMPPFGGVTIPPYGGGNLPPFAGGTIPPFGGGTVPPFGGRTISPFGGGDVPDLMPALGGQGGGQGGRWRRPDFIQQFIDGRGGLGRANADRAARNPGDRPRNRGRPTPPIVATDVGAVLNMYSVQVGDGSGPLSFVEAFVTVSSSQTGARNVVTFRFGDGTTDLPRQLVYDPTVVMGEDTTTQYSSSDSGSAGTQNTGTQDGGFSAGSSAGTSAGAFALVALGLMVLLR